MKLNFKFFGSLLLLLSILSCTSQGDKKQDNASAPAITNSPNDFQRPVVPAFMNNTKDQAEYLIVHYWNKFDFRDTMYCHAPNITDQAFANFITLFQYASPEKVYEGINKMLDSALVDVVMYNYFYKLGEHYFYDPNSPMRNDEYFIPFLEHVVSSLKVLQDDKVRPSYFLNLAYKNRPGTKALNFTYTLNSGQTGSLYGVSAKYTVLMFYNPDCIECRNKTEELKNSPVLTAAISSGTVKVLAVYPDENLQIWHEHMKDIPATWINGYDKNLSVRTNEIYDLKAIPLLYLLDRDKKVILKDVLTVGLLNQYLEQNP